MPAACTYRAALSTTSEEKAVPIRGSKRGLISGTSYEGVIRLNPYDADLVEEEIVNLHLPWPADLRESFPIFTTSWGA